MTQHGVASVIGSDGTVVYDAQPAIAAQVDSIEGEHRVTVEESFDTFGEVDGFRKADEREMMTITISPKKAAAAGSLQNALAALKYPPVPCKVVFTPHASLETTAKELFGDPAASPAGNEYIYTGGARRTMLDRQKAALVIPCWKPKSSAKTVAQLLTAAA